MIAEALRQMIERKLTTASEISELTGVATSTVYRWIHGSSEPDFGAMRLLLRHLPSIEAQQAILNVFTAGTPWQFFRTDAEMDLNRDGRVDHEDAMTASIESVRAASESLSRLRGSCERVPGLGKPEVTELVEIVGEVIRQCTLVQRIITDMVERRKQAKG